MRTLRPTNDEDAHGTHVSGIAAANMNNTQSIAGAAPDAVLFNYDVCGTTWRHDASIASGVKDAADVINMSLGGAGYSATMKNAVNYAWNKGVALAVPALEFAIQLGSALTVLWIIGSSLWLLGLMRAVAPAGR